MKNQLYKGVLLIMLSALTVTTGQLFWKLSGHTFYLILIGFALYGLGALFMMIAFRYGELSVLHPMLSISYILAIIIGYVYLHEAITATKIGGVAVIFMGMVFLGISSRKAMQV